MCGIAGVTGRGGGAARRLVGEMARCLEHRGPDGDGFYVDDELCLGMRRLAIIDPGHGQQPLYDETRSIVVVFNGEIYNHRELRAELAERGHSFRSGSDGEVLAHLYEEEGDAFCERLNGIFAIALWDTSRRRLVLARDRFGVKPLYWARTAEGISFASEVKALLRDPGVDRDIDFEALDQFLAFRFVPSPRTMMAGVRKLAPGTILVAEGGEVTCRDFRPPAPAPVRTDRRAIVEEYRTLFEQAVVRQMMSDRPIGVMLSGGVDSGAITAVMAQHSSHVRSYTMGFAEGGDANEVDLARETARRFGTEHHSIEVSADEYRDRLPESLALVEEPIGTTSALALNYVARLMREDVPVALSGQGADEPLGGYRRHLGVALAGHVEQFEPAIRLVARLPPFRGNERVRRGLAAAGSRDALGRLMGAYHLFDEAARGRLYRPEVATAALAGRPSEVVEKLRRVAPGTDLLAQMLYVDTRLWLPDELLLIADKMSMAESVELRVPFLDNDLMQLVESVASSQKVRGLSRKSIHKKAMLRWLPARIVYRKERGWATPMGAWLRTDLAPLLAEVLFDPSGLCLRLFREEELRRLVDAHARGSDDTRRLFALLSLGLWHRSLATG